MVPLLVIRRLDWLRLYRTLVLLCNRQVHDWFEVLGSCTLLLPTDGPEKGIMDHT